MVFKEHKYVRFFALALLHLRAGWLALVVLFFCCLQPPGAMGESGTGQLRIGFSSKAFVNVPKNDMKIAVGVLSRKVARKAFESVDSRIYDSSADIENALKLKKLDVIALTPDEFIHLRSGVSLEPAMITVAGNSHEVELLVLVRKGSGLNSIADLKGKTIALPSSNAQYGSIYRIWVDTLAMKEGAASSNVYFSYLKETDSASKAILPVFFRTIDACVISRQAFEITSELNPQLSRDLKAIAHISRLAGGIIAFRKELPEEYKQKTREALLALHKDLEGRQLLMLFHLNSLAPFRSEYLDATELLYAEYRERRAMVAGKR